MEKLTMKQLKHFTRCLVVACGIIWAGLVLTGCQSEPVFADFPLAPAAPAATGTIGTIGVTVAKDPDTYAKPGLGQRSDVLFIGDVITVNFNSGDTPILQPHQETIKDDGRITPPYVGSIIAKGKSPGELQAELQKLYDKLYRNMTVTVSAKERYYSISGEVKNPGPKLYLGETDILKAISSGGDFTDFAKKTKVRINRANGKTEVIDATKAIEDPKQNVPIYPGDHIIVPRRFF